MSVCRVWDNCVGRMVTGISGTSPCRRGKWFFMPSYVFWLLVIQPCERFLQASSSKSKKVTFKMHLILKEQLLLVGWKGNIGGRINLIPCIKPSAMFWVVPAELYAQLLSMLSTAFRTQRIITFNKFTQEEPVCQVEPPPSLVVFIKTLFKWGKQEKSKQIPRPTQHFSLQHSHSSCVGSITWQGNASGSCYFKILAAHLRVGLLYLVSSYILLPATSPVLYVALAVSAITT